MLIVYIRYRCYIGLALKHFYLIFIGLFARNEDVPTCNDTIIFFLNCLDYGVDERELDFVGA